MTEPFTDVASLNFTSPEAADGAPSWVISNRAATIDFGTALANGSNFYLRWAGNDVAGGGSRDEFSLDNISLSAVPEPTSMLLFGMAISGLGFRRRRA